MLASAQDTLYTPLVVHNSEGKSFSFNIMDTPGLFEVRSDKKRSNEEILEAIMAVVKDSVTSLSAVFLVFPFTSVFNQEDLQTLNCIQEFLGSTDVVKSKVYLIFSKADSFQLENLCDRLNEFLESEISKAFMEFCRGGIYFTGAISGESVLEYGEIYATKVKRKVVCLRQCLIDAIAASEPVPLSKFALFGSEGQKEPAKKEHKDDGERKSKKDKAEKK